MHLGQRIFTESLFCLKHCAKNKESLQLPRQGCFRPECRAQTYWLFTASVHSECPMPLQYQCVRNSEYSPYTTHKECPGIFRCIVHVPFLEALPLHLCGKFLDEKKSLNSFHFFSQTFLRGMSIPVLWILPELKDTLEKQFRKYVTNPSEAEYLFGAYAYAEKIGKWKKEVEEVV